LSIFTPIRLLTFSVAYLIGLACISLSYWKASRWDLAWKERWEGRRHKSVTTLRQRLQQAKILMTVVLWVLIGVFAASTLFTWWMSGRMEGPDGERMLVFTLLPTLALLLVGILFFLAVHVTKYKIERIDQVSRKVPPAGA